MSLLIILPSTTAGAGITDSFEVVSDDDKTYEEIPNNADSTKNVYNTKSW